MSRLLLFYNPVRTTPNILAIDSASAFYGDIQSNSGVWVHSERLDTLEQCGGVSGLVPMVNLLRFIEADEEKGKALFTKLLKLINAGFEMIPNDNPEMDQAVPAFFYSLQSVPLEFYSEQTLSCL